MHVKNLHCSAGSEVNDKNHRVICITWRLEMYPFILINIFALLNYKDLNLILKSFLTKHSWRQKLHINSEWIICLNLQIDKLLLFDNSQFKKNIFFRISDTYIGKAYHHRFSWFYPS